MYELQSVVQKFLLRQNYYKRRNNTSDSEMRGNKFMRHVRVNITLHLIIRKR